MKANMGTVDKVLRLVAGSALVVWAVMGGPVWAWIGVVPVVTALINFCPAYAIFGMNTCSSKSADAE